MLLLMFSMKNTDRIKPDLILRLNANLCSRSIETLPFQQRQITARKLQASACRYVI